MVTCTKQVYVMQNGYTAFSHNNQYLTGLRTGSNKRCDISSVALRVSSSRAMRARARSARVNKGPQQTSRTFLRALAGSYLIDFKYSQQLNWYFKSEDALSHHFHHFENNTSHPRRNEKKDIYIYI